MTYNLELSIKVCKNVAIFSCRIIKKLETVNFDNEKKNNQLASICYKENSNIKKNYPTCIHFLHIYLKQLRKLTESSNFGLPKDIYHCFKDEALIEFYKSINPRMYRDWKLTPKGVYDFIMQSKVNWPKYKEARKAPLIVEP
ncbi:hypothetical protein A3Q56_07665 [Intoshia linei]|uniref:Uncharacterized protein n=1 Tax=Intoshia linei TaxID=1819745 RepID=A0A177ATA4_9BILA|nr:hypothetical protein A3Q56_07665 [Intoshia linei]